MNSSFPAPDDIRDTARLVLERPEFQVETPPPGGEQLLQFLEWLIRLLLRPFVWLFNAMEGFPEPLRWLVVVALFLLLIALLGHIFYTVFSVLRSPSRKTALIDVARGAELQPADFERLADEAAADRDYIGAVRCLFRAALVSLQQREQRRLRPGITNREILSRLRDARLVDAMRLFVETIDSGWYGRQPCGEGEYRRCREAYQELRGQGEARRHA
ncbi:MAG: DUF4129 domain-containing protein [Planctomycetaceae bacterium]|nr:DUF4129 domain-containing protein [Planctomycetaceae bacterium]